MSDVIRIVDIDRNNTHVPVPPVPPVLPGARVDMRVRPGVLSDFAFVDALQKANKQGVGFMWEAAIKGHIEKGNLLIAEAIKVNREQSTVNSGEEGSAVDGSLFTNHSPRPVGYVLGADRYLKRDELGIIYQMCVAPEYRRSLVAANLLKAKFERSAYGCRLYCCWCAQDLAANRFWEAMGFVPLAFRTGGGRGKTKKDGKFRGRMHIFWQKRIREGDEGDLAQGGTAYWFPSLTGAGAIGEDRIVLPIPPGTHWGDAKPVVLPEGPRPRNGGEDEVKLLEDEVSRLEREKRAAKRGSGKGKGRGAAGQGLRKDSIELGGFRFGPGIADSPTAPDAGSRGVDVAEVERALKEAKRAVKKAKQKFDPAQVAFARELKDRWLEEVQQRPHLLAAGSEKYAVRRQIAPTHPPAPAPGSGVGSVVGSQDAEPGRVERLRLDAA